MNSPLQILDKKDQNFPSSNAGKRAVEWAKENNFKIKNREDIWRAYMARIESIFTNTSKDKNDIQNNVLANNEGKVEGRKETKAERALRFMKYKIQKENTIDLKNTDEVNKIATGLYESEKKIAVERGQGADIENLDDGQIISRYIESIKEKKEIQSESLSNWINYITGPDCTLPTWFKYHAVRSLFAMGTKNIEKGDYNKRANTTVSPHPEFNSEALGWVFNALTRELKVDEVINQVLKQKQEALGDGTELTETDKQKEAERVENIMSSDKFSKLFYFASMEVKGNLDRSFVEGEWIKYDQDSDYTLLEKGLKGKGTGWCTAEGSAKGQIESGDFYVYYSKNGKTGLYTEPRVAVRMNGDTEIAEVRGVNPSQELEPQFVEILDTKMSDFGKDEAKQYKKKSSDMKTLTQICKKDEMGQDLSKEELRFIYELDSKIEGFGYQDDPRISILQNKLSTKIKPLTGYQDCPKWAIDTAKVIYLLEKDNMKLEFSKEELRFAYEIDENIESFGRKKDPRISIMQSRLLSKTEPLTEYQDCPRWAKDRTMIYRLCKKNEMGEGLTKEEIKFIYEIDTGIQEFKNTKDPRIEDLREKIKENKLQDYISVFGMNSKENIAELKRKSNEALTLNDMGTLQSRSINIEETLESYNVITMNGFEENILPLLKQNSEPLPIINYMTFTIDKQLKDEDIINALNITEDQIFIAEDLIHFIRNQSSIWSEKIKDCEQSEMGPLKRSVSNNYFPIRQVDGTLILVSISDGEENGTNWNLSGSSFYGTHWSYVGDQVFLKEQPPTLL